MNRIFGIVKISPRASLAAEIVAVGSAVSLFSLLLGFYAAAFILADRYYPELPVESVKAVHGELFGRLAWLALLCLAVSSAIFAFFSRRHIERVFRECGR